MKGQQQEQEQPQDLSQAQDQSQDQQYSKLTKQRRWQKRRIDKGLCKICGKERNKSTIYCDTHLAKARKYQRDYYWLKKVRKEV